MFRLPASVLAASLLVSCGSTVRSITDLPLALRAPQPTNEGLVVYSDIEGGHLPPRATGIKAGSRVVVSFVACERRSVDYGAASWSCSADGTEPTPEERAVIERSTSCFRLERREASHAVIAALEGDRPHTLPPSSGTHLVFVRRTQVNRTTERIALGCENAGYQPCDPVGSRTTGRTLEQVTRTREMWVAGDGAPADPWLQARPFPAWRTNVSYARIETPEWSFAPGDSFADDDARHWLERLSQIDESKAPRAMRLSLLWDRAVLSFALADFARGASALAAVEQALGAGSPHDPIEQQIVLEAPTLHALLDGTLSLTDPCHHAAGK